MLQQEFILALKDAILALSLSMMRLGVAFAVIPAFGPSVIPGLIRQVMLLSLSLFLIPHILPQLPRPGWDLLAMLPVYAKEAFIGLMLGYLSAVVFWMAESIGFFIDNQRGASMAAAFDPMVGGQSSPLGIMLSKAIIALFFATGCFLMLIQTLYQSYQIWPVFTFFPRLNVAFSGELLRLLDDMIKTGMLYACPLIIVLFFAEFGLGLMNRFAPQLNVFILSMPIKSGLAMFLFVIYMEFLFDYFKVEFLRVPNALRLLEHLTYPG